MGYIYSVVVTVTYDNEYMIAADCEDEAREKAEEAAARTCPPCNALTIDSEITERTIEGGI